MKYKNLELKNQGELRVIALERGRGAQVSTLFLGLKNWKKIQEHAEQAGSSASEILRAILAEWLKNKDLLPIRAYREIRESGEQKERVRLRLNPEDWSEIKRLALDYGVSGSEMLRAIVEKWLDEWG